jgi:hypothetical protein
MMGESKARNYFKKVDKIMLDRGFICTGSYNSTTVKMRYYTNPTKDNRVIVFVRSKKEFSFYCGKYSDKYKSKVFSPITDEDYFNEQYDAFQRKIAKYYKGDRVAKQIMNKENW